MRLLRPTCCAGFDCRIRYDLSGAASKTLPLSYSFMNFNAFSTQSAFLSCSIVFILIKHVCHTHISSSYGDTECAFSFRQQNCIFAMSDHVELKMRLVRASRIRSSHVWFGRLRASKNFCSFVPTYNYLSAGWFSGNKYYKYIL